MAGDNSGLLQQAVQGIWAIANALTSAFPTTVGVSTVAGLPTGVVQGARAMVTDATSTIFNSVVAGGGSNIVPVFFNGTTWRIG